MNIAETAELAVLLKLGTTGSFKGATSELGAVERAAASGSMSTGRLSSGLSKAQTAAKGFGGALSHAKNELGGLISGPLGLAGLGIGLLSVGGALEGGIQKATEMGAAASKLAKITGLNVEQTSALSSALEHFGVGVDKQLRLVGFLEKNIGLLASRKDGIKNFEKTFSFALTDANGHLKDANTLLLQSADYFNNKSIPATTKAAALAKLYGRSWQDLIPILSAGSKGIAAAEEEAKQFGLTLTKDNIGQLAQLREATRSWGTALGGLEVQIGLLVVGPLTDLAKFGTKFLAENKDKVTGFFKNLIHTAQDFAAFVTGTVIPVLSGIGSAAKSAWDAVPAPIRDLLVKGFVANKAIKFLFGFSPITFAKDALGGLVKGLFQRGGTPANPLFVADVTGGLGGGALGAAGAAAGGVSAAAVASVAVVAASVIAPIVVAKLQSDSNSGIATGISNSIANQITGGASLQDLKTSLAATNTGLDQLQNMWGAQLVAGDSITQLQRDQAALLEAIRAKGGSASIFAAPAEAVANALAAALRSTQVTQGGMTAGFRSSNITAGGFDVRLATDSRAVSRAFRDVADAAHKSSAALLHINPAKSLAYALSRIEQRATAKLGHAPSASAVHGTFERDLIRYGKNILASHQTATEKLRKLEVWEAIAVRAKDWGVAKKLKADIDAAKLAQAAAAAKTTAAVKAKKLAVTINNTIPVNVSVSSRAITTVTARQNRFYNVPT